MGNKTSVHSMLGAKNYAYENREVHDYYATEPKATEMLLDLENFSSHILEPSCGGGAISEILINRGYDVVSRDLYDYGFGESGIDFLKTECLPYRDCDIITNPPYSLSVEFVKHGMELLEDGRKMALFLNINFLVSKKRRKEVFDIIPPKKVWISSSRLMCAKNGDFDKYIGVRAVNYCWFIWEKGYKGETVLGWFN